VGEPTCSLSQGSVAAQWSLASTEKEKEMMRITRIGGFNALWSVNDPSNFVLASDWLMVHISDANKGKFQLRFLPRNSE
jgi:hypothetical protein